MDRTAETANLASVVALLAAGLCLLIASPVLFLFATVDVGGSRVANKDLGELVGLPWLAYAACVVVAGTLMRCRWNLMALAIAVVPGVAEIWLYFLLRYR